MAASSRAGRSASAEKLPRYRRTIWVGERLQGRFPLRPGPEMKTPAKRGCFLDGRTIYRGLASVEDEPPGSVMVTVGGRTIA